MHVDLPLVDDVVRAAADQRRDRDDDQGVADDRLVLAATAGLADEHEIDEGQADRVADAIPVDRERPDGEGDRVRGDVDHARASVRTSPGRRPGRQLPVPPQVAPYTGPRMTASPRPRWLASA